MKFKVFAIYAMRFTVCVALAFYCVGVYAQRKEVSYFNDSVEICPLADKELIDSCYNLLDRNMMLETDGIYGQIAVIDATTSEVLAWASLEKQLDDECEGCGDMVYVPFKKNIWAISGTTISGTDVSGTAISDTTKTNNAIELALSFKQRGVKRLVGTISFSTTTIKDVLMNLRLWAVFQLITQNIPSVWLSFAPISFRQLLEC